MTRVGQLNNPSLPYTIRVRQSAWTILSLIVAGGTCIAGIVRLLTTPHPAPSWPLTFLLLALVAGALASPAALTTLRRIELLDERIRRKDPLLGTRELPYASLRSMKFEERIVTGRFVIRTRHLILVDREGRTLDINMGDFKPDDLHLLARTISCKAPKVHMDSHVRALCAEA